MTVRDTDLRVRMPDHPVSLDTTGISGLPRVRAIGDGPVSNRDDANNPLGVGELVDDAVGAHAKRAEPPQPPAQHVAGQRIAFEQAERVQYGIDEGPGELK